ncbi:MAG: Co2+/Mg2+ efflux protein ApaG [Bacteroidetes bacterium SW_11_45_7]|jgi:ApaG protein|nr:MAG: Co2+/Mg2+ efflux protein ApaG [Bacteroidetes bacterium SW_11_45_7]
MDTQTTQGVKVSVETFYQPEYSNPVNAEYMFAYQVTIENVSSNTVKLLRRQWYIYDSNGVARQVEGEGVVGRQPVLEPGEKHQYVSGCNLRTEMGKMKGYYTMERQNDELRFTVTIPEFHLIAPTKLN